MNGERSGHYEPDWTLQQFLESQFRRVQGNFGRRACFMPGFHKNSHVDNVRLIDCQKPEALV